VERHFNQPVFHPGLGEYVQSYRECVEKIKASGAIPVDYRDLPTFSNTCHSRQSTEPSDKKKDVKEFQEALARVPKKEIAKAAREAFGRDFEI